MKKQLSLLAFALLLAACGGGGGDNNAVADQQTPQPENREREALFIYRMANDERLNHPNFDFMINGGRYAYASEADRRVVIDPNTLQRGLSGVQTLRIAAQKADGTTETTDVQARSYRGFYSGTLLSESQRAVHVPGHPATIQLDFLYFTPTPKSGLPTRGHTNYHGNAFGVETDNTAAFAYHVDFGEKIGHVEIAANAYHSAIKLQKQEMWQLDYGGHQHYQFDSLVESASHGTGGYSIMLAGPNAEEIIGSISLGKENDVNDRLSVYGTRGEITP